MADDTKNTTKFGKGNPGKPKGALNKNGKAIREMIANALDKLGGETYLMECATDPKTKGAFLALIGKTMPLQVTGDGGGPVETITKIELVALK